MTRVEDLYNQAAETDESVLAKINDLITSPAPDMDNVDVEAATMPAAPEDLAGRLMELNLMRDEAASKAQPPGAGTALNYQLADRSMNALENEEFYISAGTRTKAVFADYTAPLADFFAFHEPVAGDKSSHPAAMAFDRMYSDSNNSLRKLWKKAFEPLSEWIRNMAMQKGVSQDIHRRILNYVPTLNHLITEGHAAYRETLTRDITAAEKLCVNERRLEGDYERRHSEPEAKRLTALRKKLNSAKTPGKKAIHRLYQDEYQYESDNPQSYARNIAKVARAEALA
jgi:hypothetical protein